MDQQDGSNSSSEDTQRITLACTYLSKLTGDYFADKVKAFALKKSHGGKNAGVRIRVIITHAAGVKQYTLRLGESGDEVDDDVPIVFFIISTELRKGSFWSVLTSSGEEEREIVSYFEVETLVDRLTAEPVFKDGGSISLPQLGDLADGQPVQVHPRLENPPLDAIRRGSATAPPSNSAPLESQERLGRAAGLRSTRPDDDPKEADRFEEYTPSAEERELQLKLDKSAREKYRKMVLTDDQKEEDIKEEERDATMDVDEPELPEDDTPRSHSPSPPLSTARGSSPPLSTGRGSSPPVSTATEISPRRVAVARRASSPLHEARTPPGSPSPDGGSAGGMAPPPPATPSTPLAPAASSSAASSPASSRRRSHSSSSADEEEPASKIRRLEYQLGRYKEILHLVKQENDDLIKKLNAEVAPSLNADWQQKALACRKTLEDFVADGIEPHCPIQLTKKLVDKDIGTIWKSLMAILRHRRKFIHATAHTAIAHLVDRNIGNLEKRFLVEFVATANKIIKEYEVMERVVNKFASDVIDDRKAAFLGENEILPCEDWRKEGHRNFKQCSAIHLQETKDWQAMTYRMLN